MTSNNQVRRTFRKAERLTRKKLIQELFTNGSSFFLYPIKVLYLTVQDPDANSLQVLFTVSKKNFKRAVDRNLLKRRMREAFRIRKHKIYHYLPEHSNLLIAYIYVGKEVVPYKEIESPISGSLNRIINKLEHNRDNE